MEEEFTLIEESTFIDPWKLFEIFPWSLGDLFWIKKSGKKILILKAGDRFDLSRIEKFRKLETEFDLKFDYEWIKESARQFERLEDADTFQGQRENEKAKVREEILAWAFPFFYETQETVGCVEFSSLMFSHFSKLSGEGIELFKQLPLGLAQRASLVASYSTLIALFCGYTSFRFLSDLFSVVCLFECSTKSAISEQEREAFEKERLNTGAGLEHLEGLNLGELKESFLNSPQAGLEALESWAKENLEYPELRKLISLKNEHLIGSGFPNKRDERQLTDLEKIVVFSNRIVPFEKEVFESGKQLTAILADLEEGDVSGKRIKSLLKNTFQKFESDDDEYLEVIGL